MVNQENVCTDFESEAIVATKDGWRVQEFVAADTVADFAARARDDLSLSEYQQDAEWLSIDRARPCDGVLAIAERTDTKIVSVLVARVAKTVFEYPIVGSFRFRKRLRQITVHQGPVTIRSPRSDALNAGMAALAAQLNDGAIVYLSAVPQDSDLAKILSACQGSIRRYFFVLPWGRQNSHFKIRWDGSVDAYMASLDSKTKRKNVRRAAQRIKSAFNIRVERFRSGNEAEQFLQDSAIVAVKTYQSRELGLGIDSNAGRMALIRSAASKGAFLGYIMYADNMPIAFRYGFIYGTTLFAVGTGYDPEWSIHGPGSALFLEALYDLQNLNLKIRLIDFMPHENSFKQDRANEVVKTQNYYLFARTLRGFSLFLPIYVLENAKRMAQAFNSRLRNFPPQEKLRVSGNEQ
ncbi:MAG: GNAT family N-acetyltransferase [Alphaproteobacteria bacterium]|nr:GNAT family N-acetyltransferase [Alphaproteobacteria bacterium]